MATEEKAPQVKKSSSAQAYIIAGVFTFIPLWLTWFVFRFLFNILSDFGTPWARQFSQGIKNSSPELAKWLIHPWFVDSFAVLLTLLGLYVLGWATTHVLGSKLLQLVEYLLNKIPIVQTIYGSSKKFLHVLQSDPEKIERVVLINFPNDQMKTVGFVTTTFRDYETDVELASVYVPTTPNPTSGYLEIVPISTLTSTDWTFEEAMTFIVSGGAVAPEKIKFN